MQAGLHYGAVNLSVPYTLRLKLEEVSLLEIRPANHSDLDSFFDYLDDHLSDNGLGNTPLFQPMARSESCLNDGMKSGFADGIETELGCPGWRRLWLAFEGDNVIGHIDIRSHPESHTSHRALLGMGVDRSFRKLGLGSQLLSTMFSWVAENTSIDCMDLWVLSSNTAAQNLYLRNSFKRSGEIEDMFRIDGQSLSYTLMSRKVAL